MWGLEYALLFGLPSNKLELIDGRTRCAFPFRTRAEGESHLDAWIETLCRWKNLTAEPTVREGRTKRRTRVQQEVGRFRFTRRGRHVHLDVAVDARKYQELLRRWSDRAAWDWGEE